MSQAARITTTHSWYRVYRHNHQDRRPGHNGMDRLHLGPTGHGLIEFREELQWKGEAVGGKGKSISETEPR